MLLDPPWGHLSDPVHGFLFFIVFWCFLWTPNLKCWLSTKGSFRFRLSDGAQILRGGLSRVPGHFSGIAVDVPTVSMRLRRNSGFSGNGEHESSLLIFWTPLKTKTPLDAPGRVEAIRKVGFPFGRSVFRPCPKKPFFVLWSAFFWDSWTVFHATLECQKKFG